MKSRRDERGAVAVMVASSLVLLLGISAFAVDLGMQRVLRRDLQALADVAALDLSRPIPGRTVTELKALAPDIVTAVLSRNTYTLGDDAGTTSDDPRLTFRYGKATQAADGSTSFTPGAEDSFPNAVEVTASNEVGFAFASGDGGASRRAVATVEGGACFGIGSYAANLDTSTSPVLGPLLTALGSNVALSAADYTGIANTDVDLVDLLGTNVGVGTLEELVRGDELVNLGTYYLAVAEVARRGSGDTAAVRALERIGLAVGPLNRLIPASELLALGTGGTSGLEAATNALDLITAGAAIATGEYAISVPQAAVNLGPVANVRTTLNIIEGPRLACGRKNDPAALAENSQIRLDLSTTAADVSIPGLLGTRVSLTGSISGASAKGQLTDVRCSPTVMTVRVSDGLLKVDLTLQVTVEARVAFIRIPVVGGPIKITGESTSAGDATIELDEDTDYDNPVRVDNNSSGLPDLNVDTSGLALIGLPVGIVLSPIVDDLVEGLVDPLIASLDGLLTPLLRNLGMDLSGADVFAKRTPRCDNATLRG